jgi:hypothetical protein
MTSSTKEKTFLLFIGPGPDRPTDGTYVPTNLPSHYRFINRDWVVCNTWKENHRANFDHILKFFEKDVELTE